MRESRTYGSARGASSDGRSYREGLAGGNSDFARRRERKQLISRGRESRVSAKSAVVKTFPSNPLIDNGHQTKNGPNPSR